ncbi:MAG: hypothetical protein WCR40_02830 [Candidatus Paceibacterota bacterium]
MKKISLVIVAILTAGIFIPSVSFSAPEPELSCSANGDGTTYIGSTGEVQATWTASFIGDLSGYDIVWTDNAHLGTTYPSSNTMTNTYTSSELGEQSVAVEIGNGVNSYTAICSTNVAVRTLESITPANFTCSPSSTTTYVGSTGQQEVSWTTNFDSLDLANPSSYEFVWTDNAHLGTTYPGPSITNSYGISELGNQTVTVQIGDGVNTLTATCDTLVKARTLSSLSVPFSCSANPSTIYVGSSTKNVAWTTNFDLLDLANPDSYEFVWTDNAYLATQYGDVKTITNSYDNTKLGTQTVKVEIGNGEEVLSANCPVNVVQEKTTSYVTPGDFICWAEPASVTVDSTTLADVIWKTNFGTLGLTDGNYEFIWTDNAHLGTTYPDIDSITNKYNFSELGNQTVTVNVGNGGDVELSATCNVSVQEKKITINEDDGGNRGGSSSGGGSTRNTCTLVGNIDNDTACDADILDFNLLALNWGSTVSGNRADLNNDGIVDILDFNILALNWTGTL